MAREYWPVPTEALGKRIRAGRDGPWTEIVGVAENVYSDGLNKPAPATVYLRVGVVPPAMAGGAAVIRRDVAFAVRSERAGSQAFLRDVADAIHGVNSSLPLAKVRTLGELYIHSMARTSFALVLLGIAGVMALILAIVGVYGVLAYAVSQRRREVCIRLALGAQPDAVKLLFIRRGMILTCVGGAAGLALAAVLSRWISSVLFGVTPLDPVTYLAAGSIITVAALVASYVPARLAASADPTETLRCE